MRQFDLFDLTPEHPNEADLPLAELYAAYFECRRKKRNTRSAQAFELDFESNLVQLWTELLEGTYQPGPSVAFIVNQPVKREVFAADFRDRVVHHWIIGRLNPYFEKAFIHDSYACRPGKGVLFGIRRVDRFIRQCTRQYSRDAWVLKLDIRGFFMHIDKAVLFERLTDFTLARYPSAGRALLLELCHKTLFNEPTLGCVVKGDPGNWQGLPADKSLFAAPHGRGLPIGNLTSQVFANFYLNPFDHWIKHDQGMRYYGRYVDDFVLVHEDRERLRALVPIIRDYLREQLRLELHPRKIYLQHYTKGLPFLGTIIQPGRIAIGKRIKGNFYAAIQTQNAVVKGRPPDKDEESAFLSSMNAYLGLLKHHASFRLRKRMLFRHLSEGWWNRVSLAGGCARFVKRRRRSQRRRPWRGS